MSETSDDSVFAAKQQAYKVGVLDTIQVYVMI